MLRRVVFALALAAAAQARAQGEAKQAIPPVEGQQPAPGTAPQAAGGTSDLLRRCGDLLAGRMPADEKETLALKEECSQYMLAQADKPQQQASVQAGRGTEPVGEGKGVLAAFGQAANELAGPERGKAMGFRRNRPVEMTLVTNPIGWFNGLGVNLELYRAFKPKLSWIAGGRYSNTDVSNGNASTFGIMGGIDWYIVGRNNEGLRIGPRLELATGREDFEGDTTFGRVSLAGEVGYNFIATNGITGLLAGGVGGRIAGDEQNEDFAGFAGGEFGPFVKLGLGYSW